MVAIRADYFPYDWQPKTGTDKLSQARYYLVRPAGNRNLAHQLVAKFWSRLSHSEPFDHVFNKTDLFSRHTGVAQHVRMPRRQLLRDEALGPVQGLFFVFVDAHQEISRDYKIVLRPS